MKQDRNNKSECSHCQLFIVHRLQFVVCFTWMVDVQFIAALQYCSLSKCASLRRDHQYAHSALVSGLSVYQLLERSCPSSVYSHLSPYSRCRTVELRSVSKVSMTPHLIFPLQFSILQSSSSEYRNVPGQDSTAVSTLPPKDVSFRHSRPLAPVPCANCTRL